MMEEILNLVKLGCGLGVIMQDHEKYTSFLFSSFSSTRSMIVFSRVFRRLHAILREKY